MSDLQQKAIEAALNNHWQNAIDINKEILSSNPDDIEALNRLAYAYSQIGSFKMACQIYKQVLELDRFNHIAHKNLEKVNKQQGVKKKIPSSSFSLSPTLFIEEPGKTKVIPLVNIAPSSVLAQLKAGQPVDLVPKRHGVEVRDGKIYLGVLPDDLSFHLKRLIRAGNRYQAYIKGLAKNSLIVFIKELKRSRRQSQPTFIQKGQAAFYSFVPKDFLPDTDEFSSLEEEA